MNGVQVTNFEKENSIEQEDRMRRLFRHKAEEGDGFAMIAYTLMLVADSNFAIASELPRIADGGRKRHVLQRTATGSKESMKRRAMWLGSTPYWRSTSRPQKSPAVVSILKPCKTSCRGYAPRSLSTKRRAASCHF